MLWNHGLESLFCDALTKQKSIKYKQKWFVTISLKKKVTKYDPKHHMSNKTSQNVAVVLELKQKDTKRVLLNFLWSTQILISAQRYRRLICIENMLHRIQFYLKKYHWSVRPLTAKNFRHSFLEYIFST